jgi:YD repeat-containing protein
VRGWKKTAYTYNANQRLASVAVTNLSSAGVANETLTTTYDYRLYGNGMVQTMTVSRPTPGGISSDTYAYDARGNLTSVTNALGQATTYGNYNALGQPGHIVGPNGDVTDITYDARGRVASKTTYPNNTSATWTYAYDGFGLLYTQSSPDGQVTTWNRDPVTMRVNTITRNDKDGPSTESFVYNANGDVLEHKVSRGDSIGLRETYHYDALGRVYQKVGQNGQLLSYTYDGNGNVLSVTNAAGHKVSYTYDALDRVAKKVESDTPPPPAVPSVAPTLSAPANSSDTVTA